MKLVAFSDTHYTYSKDPAGRMLTDLMVPDGDILIHAGDATFRGKQKEWRAFMPWWSATGKAFKHRILIPGNHDIDYRWNESNLTIDLEGVRFGLFPWVPNLPQWAFHATEEWMRARLEDMGLVDVLISHGPPNMILDRDLNGNGHYGSTALFDYVLATKPKVHIFGHVHEAHGSLAHRDTRFYNVAICDRDYNLINPVTEIEL